MLSSTATPLRRRVIPGLQKVAERFSGHRRPNTVAVITRVPFAHASSSNDGVDEGHRRYHSVRPISIVPGPSSSSETVRHTCSSLATVWLGGAAGDCIPPPYGTLQLRFLGTVPSRSSTSATHPPGSFSSKVPTDGRKDDSNHDHHIEHNKLDSAREKGREVAKRGRAAAKTGAKAAKKGALSMRDMIQKYGWTFLGTYFGLYFATVGSLFAGIDSGLLDPASVMSAAHWMHGDGSDSGGDAAEVKSTVEILAHFLENWEWTKPYAESIVKNPHAANLGMAWLAAKFTEPLRIVLCFGIVPRVHKALGKALPEDDEQKGAPEEHEDGKK